MYYDGTKKLKQCNAILAVYEYSYFYDAIIGVDLTGILGGRMAGLTIKVLL